MPSPLTVLRKIGAHLRLLRHDPEAFGANLLQFTDPARFQAKILDVMTAAPLHARIDPALRDSPALNVLQPILSPESMTGGPNTIVNIAFWVAKHGIPVRIMTTRADPGTDPEWFWRHLASVTGDASRPPTLSVAPANDPANPRPIGARDMFLATHWTTAQQVKAWLPRMETKRLFYLIQDFEPGFYAWSSNHALALETYGLDHIGVFNERFLYDYLVVQGPAATPTRPSRVRAWCSNRRSTARCSIHQSVHIPPASAACCSTPAPPIPVICWGLGLRHSARRWPTPRSSGTTGSAWPWAAVAAYPRSRWRPARC